ncbi:hypothetical protein U3516DRAFT_775101 [Neocallimastix sp. 'constans']
MKLQYLFNLFLIFIPVVISSSCNNIDKYLSEKVHKCIVNKEGKITQLDIVNDYENPITEAEVNKLLSYKDITNLDFSEIPDQPGYVEIPKSINNLKNLESLKIEYESEYHPCTTDCEYGSITTMGNNVLENLKSLKFLYLSGIAISQDNINEIATLTNLEDLTFYHCYLDKSINYSTLGNLKKLNKLNVINVALEYVTKDISTFYPNDIPEGLIKANKNIEELTMVIDPVKITKKDLPNLKKLKLSWFYDSAKDFDSSFVEDLELTDLEFTFRGFYAGIGDKYLYGNISADLSKLKSLKSLTITLMNITQKLMDNIINIPNLEKIDLHNNNILDEKYDEKMKKINEKIKNRVNTIAKNTITITITKNTTGITTTLNKKAESTVVNNRCGKKFGNLKCPSGECCSKHGWCGKSDIHCNVLEGCQSEFGKCNSTENQLKGRCGMKFGNLKCPSGECCSKHGWCGKSDIHCNVSEGCQSEFGKCN